MKAVIAKSDLVNIIGKIQSIVSVKPSIPILANVLLEAIDDQRLADRGGRAVGGEIEQGVAREPGSQGHDGAVGAAGLAGDLAQAGAGEQTVEDRLEEFGPLQVVGGGEGLGAEGGAAVSTAEPLDALG